MPRASAAPADDVAGDICVSVGLGASVVLLTDRVSSSRPSLPLLALVPSMPPDSLLPLPVLVLSLPLPVLVLSLPLLGSLLATVVVSLVTPLTIPLVAPLGVS
jgi:hypothetical protein